MKMLFVVTPGNKEFLVLERNLLKSCTCLGEIDVADDVVEKLRDEQAGPQLRALAFKFFHMGNKRLLGIAQMREEANKHGDCAAFLRSCIVSGARAASAK